MRNQGGWRVLCAGVGLVAACAALVVGARPARADGPDVIVGDIMDNGDYGTANGRHMYAIGTYSCNLGTANLTWSQNNNLHPVITQNIYRLANGRFEQVGQSWVKHGFCALQDSICTTCSCPSCDCSSLRPGCSDPYTYSLNGTPGYLGPKSDVNAFTGAFPYPYTGSGGSTTNSNNKLLSATTADLDAGLAAGALWFVSSMYVQPEDAASKNNMNNESYRRVTIGAASGSPAYAMTLRDTTQRMKAGVYAWRDNGLGAGQPDPDVFIGTADAPSDGRFVVAAKATSLGGGQWHYEYAVQNYNSDRSGGSFSIPLPAGAVATNLGFHGVLYYNSEAYSSTDWTGVVGASTVSWSTQAYATNTNANALRWDTTYNFRFDCNIPPAGGQGSIGLFKPGTGTSVSAATVVPSSDGLQHPINDTCANAAPIGAGVTPFSNVGATTDGPDEPGSCNFSSYSQIDNDVWYLYTSNTCTTGTTTITTCGSTFDTKIAVYPGGSCPTTGGSVIACNDDTSACTSGDGTQSSVTFTAAPSTNYRIRVGGYLGATGTGFINITAPFCGPVAPTNDACANAPWIADGAPVTGTTILATNDGTANCGQSASSPDVWYKYKPLVANPSNGTTASVNVNTCGSGYDTVISVYTGSCGALTQVKCNDDNGDGTGNSACSSGGPTPGSSVDSGLTYVMTVGTSYYIRVAGYGGATGNFIVRAIGGGGVLPPANDDCANRATIGLGATAFSNLGATTDGPAHTGCNLNGNNQITGDLWWKHTGQSNGSLRIDTCAGAGFDTKIAVYTGTGCSNLDGRLMTCSDDGDCAATRAVAFIPTQAGAEYTIRVGGFNGAVGSGTLTLSVLHSDINGDGAFTVADIFAFLTAWFTGDPRGDYNLDHVTNVSDIFAFLSDWFNRV